MSNRRNSSLDITRIAAVLAVVMIHASAGFVSSYGVDSAEFIWGNIFDSISRLGVPLFVMISGSLMLDEDRNIRMKSLYFEKIKNIICLLIFWSALYCGVYKVILPQMKGEHVNFSSVAISFINGHYHMWYLYMIIGLYLITPFLREFVKKDNEKLVRIFIAAALIIQFTQPMLNGLSQVWGNAAYLVKFTEKFCLGFFGGYTAYYLAGWYIIHIGIKRKWMVYTMGIASLPAVILYVQMTGDYANGYSNQNIFVFLYSAAVFTALNRRDGRALSDKGRKILERLSDMSFGVYIVHPLLLTAVGGIFVYGQRPFLYIPCYFAIVTALSFAGCFLVSKLPVIKKVIRM